MRGGVGLILCFASKSDPPFSSLNTVRAELVEALPCLCAVVSRKGQSFDKLRTNGGFTDEVERLPTDAGFTLVELIVALFIFGLLAAAGVSLLNGSVRAQESSKRHLDRVEVIGRMSTLIGHDLALAIGRPVQEAQGLRSALVVEDGRRVAWTRGGPPHGTERIELAITDGALIRTIRSPAESETVSREILARDVSGLGVRSRTQGIWTQGWAATNPIALPDALELTVTMAGSPPLRLAFIMGPPR